MWNSGWFIKLRIRYVWVQPFTPTWYNMHDDYTSSIKASLTEVCWHERFTRWIVWLFSHHTFKAIGSLAFIIGKYGLISGDYEFTDISEARLMLKMPASLTRTMWSATSIQTMSTLHIGAEYRIGNYSILRRNSNDKFLHSILIQKWRSGITRKPVMAEESGIRDNDLFIDIGYLYTEK